MFSLQEIIIQNFGIEQLGPYIKVLLQACLSFKENQNKLLYENMM